MDKGQKNRARKTLFVLIGIMLLYYIPNTVYNRYFNIKLIPITENADGSDSLVVLPDGSEVFLHQDASITFTKEFPDDRRKTELRGGASVQIKKDVRPFKLKIKRCLLISNHGRLLVKKINAVKYEVLVENGDFGLEEYNKDGELENLYSLGMNDKVIIGEYAEIK